MGGSLGLALRARRDRKYYTLGWARRAEVRDRARAEGFVDEVFDAPRSAVADADMAVLCVPVLAMKDVLTACADALPSRCIVTDVGSTKAELMRTLPAVMQGRGAGFCGSHPIAGSEQQGLEAARADLYENAVVVVTPPAPDSPLADVVAALWKAVGANVRMMEATEHDRIMARTSHLPHMIAAVLSATVGRGHRWADIAAFCGPGFRDATRIADGAPEIWRDIIETNIEHIAGEMAAFQGQLESLRNAVRQGNMEEVVKLLEEARRCRRQIMVWRGRAQGEQE